MVKQRMNAGRSLLALFFVITVGLATLTTAHAQIITGFVVDAENRNKLDSVEVTLLEDEQSVLVQRTQGEQAFQIDYEFDDKKTYQLTFNKADFFPEQIDLSNALNSGELPDALMVSLSGEDSELVFQGHARNRETLQPIDGIQVTMVNRMTGEKVVTQSDSDGLYQLNISSGYEYTVTLESPNHLKRFANINYCNDLLEKLDKFCFSGFNDISLNEQSVVTGASVLLDKIELGKTFKVDNIYYDYNKASIKNDAIPNLRKVLYILMDNPQITIELGSHADSRGSDQYNLDLSQRRADAAVEYIVGQGITENRIESKGYGETVLVNHCKNGVSCTDEVHGQNRRTEFIIVGIDATYFAKN